VVNAQWLNAADTMPYQGDQGKAPVGPLGHQETTYCSFHNFCDKLEISVAVMVDGHGSPNTAHRFRNHVFLVIAKA
jgi:hypothetical protein